MAEENELSQYLVFNTVEVDENDNFKWSYQNTLLFLDLYKKYRDKVGSQRIKTLKKMFEEIAKELQSLLKTKVSASNSENRWKVLERNYKKVIDNNNKTGRGRKDFEYEDIMNEILGKKRNVHPILVLSSETVSSLANVDTDNIPGTSSGSFIEIMDDNTAMSSTISSATYTKSNETNKLTTPSATNRNSTASRKRLFSGSKNNYRAKQLRATVLTDIRNDRREYYKKRLEIEERKLEEKVKKNKLLEDSNRFHKKNID